MGRTLDDLQALAAEARTRGARGFEALETERAGLTWMTRGRNIDRSQGSDQSLTVRVWVDDGRRGVAHGHPDRQSDLLAHAFVDATSAPKEPNGGPVRPGGAPPRGLGIDDPRHDQLTDEDRTDVLVSNQRACVKENGPVIAGPFLYRESRELRRFVSNRGAAYESRSTLYEASGEVTLATPTGPIRLTDRVAGRSFSATACLPFGAMLGRRAAALIPVSSVSPDGPIRVLLPPRSVAPLLSWLAAAFTHQHLVDGDTLLSRAPLGEPLFHRRLHIVDDGLAPGGLRTRPFDDRGVVPEPMPILREGCVAGRYLDPETARTLDARPTGHTDGEVLRPSNLQLNGGTRSIHALLGEQDQRVFEVDALDPSGIDLRTGLFDLVVNGVLHDRHKSLGAWRGVHLVGDLVAALQQVVAVSSDTDRILDVDAPGLFLDGLSVRA